MKNRFRILLPRLMKYRKITLCLTRHRIIRKFEMR